MRKRVSSDYIATSFASVWFGWNCFSNFLDWRDWLFRKLVIGSLSCLQKFLTDWQHWSSIISLLKFYFILADEVFLKKIPSQACFRNSLGKRVSGSNKCFSTSTGGASYRCWPRCFSETQTSWLMGQSWFVLMKRDEAMLFSPRRAERAWGVFFSDILPIEFKHSMSNASGNYF